MSAAIQESIRQNATISVRASERVLSLRSECHLLKPRSPTNRLDRLRNDVRRKYSTLVRNNLRDSAIRMLLIVSGRLTCFKFNDSRSKSFVALARPLLFLAISKLLWNEFDSGRMCRASGGGGSGSLSEIH